MPSPPKQHGPGTTIATDAAAPDNPTLDPKTFAALARLVYESSGIVLGERKASLLAARVAKRMRALSIQSYDKYLRYVQENDAEIVHFIDAISTNVTSFFREDAHFQFLAKAVERWHAQGQQRFRFWSAACSSGEEPYTMAMVLDGILGRSRADVRILATDISTNILGAARRGVYSREKLGNLPAGIEQRYFDRRGGDLAVSESVKRYVSFNRLNLSQPPFPMKGPFDIILCRNVMIYFDNAVRRRMIGEFVRLLRPGGYLMVGHTESLTGMIGGLRAIQPAIYMVSDQVAPNNLGQVAETQ